MSETERLIKELKSKKVSDKEVEARVKALNFKSLTSNFKSYSRDRRDQIFSNKTNPPAVGAYHPISLDFSRTTHIDREHETTDQAIKRKLELGKKN
jgi:hypothetical protein